MEYTNFWLLFCCCFLLLLFVVAFCCCFLLLLFVVVVLCLQLATTSPGAVYSGLVLFVLTIAVCSGLEGESFLFSV